MRTNHLLLCVGSWFWYWRQMDDGFCYWRWLEYSASASIMAMAIALAMGLREQNILAGIFMLHWSTMMFGFLVEYVSVPKYHADYTKYKTPIGPEEFEDFVNSPNKETWTTQVDYSDPDRGRNALKLIDQAEWEGDTPAADLRMAHQRMEKDAAAVREQGGDGALVVRRYRRFIWSQKCRNYVRCAAALLHARRPRLHFPRLPMPGA